MEENVTIIEDSFSKLFSETVQNILLRAASSPFLSLRCFLKDALSESYGEMCVA